MISTILMDISQKMAEGGYVPQGNCFEAAIASGIKLASNPDSTVRLVKGNVRGICHWWLLVDGKIVDPTSNQFQPIPLLNEYLQERLDGMDLYAISFLLK